MAFPPKEPELKSIALDEIKATLNRLQIIADNSSDPVERMVAIQLSPVMSSNIRAVESLLMTPGLEEKAKAFCAELDGQEEEGK